jgi:hypothetical protein
VLGQEEAADLEGLLQRQGLEVRDREKQLKELVQ